MSFSKNYYGLMFLLMAVFTGRIGVFTKGVS